MTASIGIRRREALAGLGIVSVTAAAPAAWKPIAKLVDRRALSGVVPVSSFPGADDAEQIVNAFNAAPDGATILFDPGGVSRISRLVSIGNGGDVRTARGVRVIANGHTFVYTADGARLEFNGPISAVQDLAADYAAGSRTLMISHAGNLGGFVPGGWVKIVSDALDGWNRNRGNQQGQYRLGEWAQLSQVVDHGNMTATLTLANPLRFTRGFVNRGDASDLSEVDTYTRANNVRVFALLCDDFSWTGGTFYVENAAAHLGPQGWNTRSLLRVQGFATPVIRNVALGPGVGKGLEIQGCVNFSANGIQVRGLPDFPARTTRGSVRQGSLGYGIAIGGCWGGEVNNLVAQDCRHAVTESNSTLPSNSPTYGLLLSMGRTYGTRINNPRVTGRFSAAIDTHHGAHAWVISNAIVDSAQDAFGISIRGPDHVVIAPNLRVARGIQLYSEFNNDGGADLPGLVGKGNRWMSSAKVIGGSIDCTTDALVARDAYLTIESGLNIRSRSDQVFTCDGGVLDIASGGVGVQVTGSANPGPMAGKKQRSIFSSADSNPAYGITWAPGVLIRPPARVNVDASASADAAPVNVFGQDGTRAQAVIQGRLTVSLPPRAAGAMFANSIRYQIDRSAVVDFRARRPLVPGSRFRS